MIILFMFDFKLCVYLCNRDGRNNEGLDCDLNISIRYM